MTRGQIFPNNFRLMVLLFAICPFLLAFSWGKYEGRLFDEETRAPVAGALVVAQWEECAGFGHCNSFCVHSEISETDSSGKYVFKAWSDDAPITLFYKPGYKGVRLIPLGHVGNEFRFLKKSDVNGRRYSFSRFTGTSDQRLDYLGSISLDCSSRDSNGNLLLPVYEKILDEANQYNSSRNYKRTLLRLCRNLGYAYVRYGAVKVPYPTEEQVVDFLKKNRPDCRIATFTYKDIQDFEQAVQHDDVQTMNRFFSEGLEMENLSGGQHALWLAAEYGRLAAMELLFEHGADLQGGGNAPSLIVFKMLDSTANYTEKRKMLSMLKRRGAALNGKNENHQTLFQYALYRRNANDARMLIDEGVGIDGLAVADCYRQLYDSDESGRAGSVPVRLEGLLPEGTKLKDGMKINGSCRTDNAVTLEKVSHMSKKVFDDTKIRGSRHLFRLTVNCDKKRLQKISDDLAVDETYIVRYAYLFKVNAKKKEKARIEGDALDESVKQCIVDQYYKDITFDSRPGAEENILIKVDFPAVLGKGMTLKIPAAAN